MDWLEKMNHALDYIETNLTGEIDLQCVSQKAQCSAHNFQRMFSFITDITLSEYIRRRRLSQAAQELQCSDIKVIDLALKYGYDSPVSFTRAFQALHNIPPSKARHSGVLLKSYPKISFQISIKGDKVMNYRIENKASFSVYGIKRTFHPNKEDCTITIPKFWGELLENGEYDKLEKTSTMNSIYEIDGWAVINGISIISKNALDMEYMICSIKNEKDICSDYEILEIPEATWAIFRTPIHSVKDAPKDIHELSKRIYTEWIPNSNFEYIEGFEMDVNYYKNDNECYEEKWIRVRSKKQY